MTISGINPYTALSPAPAKTAGATPTSAEPQTSSVSESVADFKTAIEGAEKAALQTAATGADPHAMVEAFANAEMVLDTAITIRDKVVEAYQELLRMPV